MIPIAKHYYYTVIWQGLKFGGLAVRAYNLQIKIRQYFLYKHLYNYTRSELVSLALSLHLYLNT